jgi:tRNA-2-methylthio-N6-dimethylallyladenosine synthase
MPSLYFETFGCQMNEADSRYVAGRALAAGYSIAQEAAGASVVVLNTCTVRDNAEQRAYGRMQHFRALKNADPGVKLVVMGCLAEQDRERMRTIAPHVDAVFGTSELERLGDTLAAWRDEFAEDDGFDPALLREPLGGTAGCVSDAFTRLRAFATVQRGCSYYCTFCIVPFVRGRFDHRPIGDILADVRAAAAAGAREILLVGQTVNAYRDPAGGAEFADLLGEVAAIDALERIAFVTSHPKDYTEKLARTMGSLPKLNPRFHLPLQSGSNAILRRMNRKYTVEQYLDKIAMFREYCPDWALTTDLIVAFPGETEADFQATLELCERMGFAQAYSFIYSPRRGTPAARWEPVAAEAGADRLRRLNATIDRGVLAYHGRMAGRTVRALVQGHPRRRTDRIAAKTPDNVTVIAPAPALDDAALARRPWLDIRVEEARVWGCMGTVMGTAERFEGPAAAAAGFRLIDLVAPPAA